MSSVSVSCCQPPASSMAVRRQTPAVPLKLKKTAAAGARAVLDDEMAVEQDAFDFGERRVMAVEVGPARLHHGQLGVGEIGHRAAQKIGAGQEIGVEDGDEFAGGGLQAFGQRAGLVALAIGAMQVVDIDAEGLVALDAGARDLLRFVGGIVEHLDLEQLARIIETRDGVDQALDHVALVVDGKLYGNLGPLGRSAAAGRAHSCDA